MIRPLKILIRWLARAEIVQAMDAGVELGKGLAQMETEARCAIAYARGELAGQMQAFDAVEQEVGSRRSVEPEDVIRARKRGAH